MVTWCSAGQRDFNGSLLIKQRNIQSNCRLTLILSIKMGRPGQDDLQQGTVLEVTLSSDYESGARGKVTWKGFNLKYSTSLFLCTHGNQWMNVTDIVAPRLFPLVQPRVWHIRFFWGVNILQWNLGQMFMVLWWEFLHQCIIMREHRRVFT